MFHLMYRNIHQGKNTEEVNVSEIKNNIILGNKSFNSKQF